MFCSKSNVYNHGEGPPEGYFQSMHTRTFTLASGKSQPGKREYIHRQDGGMRFTGNIAFCFLSVRFTGACLCFWIIRLDLPGGSWFLEHSVGFTGTCFCFCPFGWLYRVNHFFHLFGCILPAVLFSLLFRMTLPG